MPLHEELRRLADPVLDRVTGHPFWAGLRDGDTPPGCLTHFVVQDTDHLLPAYARALAGCAAGSARDEHTKLLGRSVLGSLEARDRLRGAYRELAGELGAPPPPEPGDSTATPATRAHADFFRAAAATSLAAGVGALLPMVIFNHRVAEELRTGHRPGSRYARWIEVYHPGPHYGYAVRGFLTMVDEVAEGAGEVGRRQLLDHFRTAVAYEWAFAEEAWRGGGSTPTRPPLDGPFPSSEVPAAAAGRSPVRGERPPQ